jgi:hypothetical protein
MQGLAIAFVFQMIDLDDLPVVKTNTHLFEIYLALVNDCQ